MHIVLLEPYYGGSHRQWADSYARQSTHDVHLLTMPAQFWKWRLQGGAVTLAHMLHNHDHHADLILASSMLNLASFRALTRHRTTAIPIALYLHETQLTYPQNSRQSHGWRYGFINYISALAADRVYFNSQYHQDVFFETLPKMLKHFGDFNELETVDELRERSTVLPLGLDLSLLDHHQITIDNEVPLIVWNHRWEEDKNPKAFIRALIRLARDDIPFQVAITGENTRPNTDVFKDARQALGDRIVQLGYLPTFEAYARLLWRADYVVSTAHQEFFGGAVAQAIYCRCIPLLPDRLNYPALIPEEAHDACLYKGDSLVYALRQHLTGDILVDTAALREHVRRYDWGQMAPIYDETFEALVARYSSGIGSSTAS
jgi:glycosyltransferase involved in cell wall biosynthesis